MSQRVISLNSIRLNYLSSKFRTGPGDTDSVRHVNVRCWELFLPVDVMPDSRVIRPDVRAEFCHVRVRLLDVADRTVRPPFEHLF